ncbi:DNA topoisomerase-3 [Chromohalobacter marismortui]|uniref:DNA topoisomerase n=1 Tax=Chromohalobacter marismortui TaxID=42055 RepID=A0A4R7NR14_9GAMM|nr:MULTISPECIES: DNA topoisomerase III [Chromohalobacter]MCI0508481.1 DNA topoisomerase III [Chromohalobacter sp.]MCI0592228.1 DNA topoisomerase III [Chromohalobacter sp.]TDU22961.1 DNA topoisomerase-3 [Chromohalobacter marismortui]
MRLIVAEKPSLARAIADALPAKTQRQDGYLECEETCISWCVGHLLEQAPPDAYDARYQQWRLDDLPIVPQQWQLIPRAKARAQLAVIRKLLKRADSVVHAGDPDREGQLLVQRVIERLGWRGPMSRLLISDLNRPAVQRALRHMEDNARYQSLFEAAETRSRADWLYGINLSRAWTLTGRHAGYSDVLSVGRVQTPVLGLIVRRDLEIERFVPRPFYTLWADLGVEHGMLRAWWQPQAPHPLDDQGRLLTREPAEALAARLPGAEGHLSALQSKKKSQTAPLPYSLSALQVDAARRYKLSAKRVLDICQALYERHQLITYPRSDCRYLPEGHFAAAKKLLSAACATDETLAEWLSGADFSRRSRAWNDKQVGAHHALAPTGRPFDAARLSHDEANVFRLIARNVLAQFYPPLETRDVKAEFSILGECFRAQGREILVPGWKPLFTTRDEAPALPALREGEAGKVRECAVEDRQTRPPEPFSDASLIKAMMNIARYVDDEAVRRTLRDTDGLGTEATRAGILETLITRGYVIRQQGALRATRPGRALVQALPDTATRPERTALWEQRLAEIAEGNADATAFLDTLVGDVRQLLSQADAERMRQALATHGGPEPSRSTHAKPKNARRRTAKRSQRTTTRKKGPDR